MSIKESLQYRIDTYQKEYDKAIEEGEDDYAAMLKDRIDRFKKQLTRL